MNQTDTRVSSCMMCGHGFEWDANEHDGIPDKCEDCRAGNPPTLYRD